MRITKLISFAVVLFLFTPACVTNRAVVRSDYNFAAIKTVRVGNFASGTSDDNSGIIVQNAFMKHLMIKGYRVVVDPKLPADVLIEGSVTAFLPDKKYLIRGTDTTRTSGHGRGRGQGRGRGYSSMYSNDVVEISGSNMYDLGTAFGLGGNSKIMASNATVGIYAYMTDSTTGEVVWSDSYTYEGLDLSSALDGAVKYILRSVPKENIAGGI